MMLLSLPLVATLATAAVAVDKWLGEPRRAHPLVGFGKLAAKLEAALNTGRRGRLFGILAWLLAVAPPVLIATWLVLTLPLIWSCALHVALLYFALGARSLHDHIEPIGRALAKRDLAQARVLTARIVSRETSHADERWHSVSRIRSMRCGVIARRAICASAGRPHVSTMCSTTCLRG
jgi:adenosylcobinamide-phosphate synthase